MAKFSIAVRPAAAVGALTGNKRRTADGALGPTGAAAEIIALARGTRGLVNGEDGPGTECLPDLILSRFPRPCPDLLKVLTLDTAAASIRKPVHLILRDNTFRPADTAAAIGNRTPGIDQAFQHRPGAKGLTGQIAAHKRIAGTAAACRASVPKRTPLHQLFFPTDAAAEKIPVPPLQRAFTDHRPGTILIPDLNRTRSQTHHPAIQVT